MELESIEGIWLWRNWNGFWQEVWLVGIQFLHLSLGMMNSLNCGIQKIPSCSFHEPNITKKFGQKNLSFQFHQIPLNSTNQTTLRACLVRIMEFDGIGIHRRNLTLNELEWNLTTHLVGRNSLLHISQGMMNSLNCRIQWSSKDSIKFIPWTK